ncbi:MAG TPA: prepilin peptidase, partial [Patescibacteria group bacterium]|nr:prepilin peptidase [Patescibacteria group bacterium]
CPSCQQDLAVRDLIPVLSWLWLRGRCRRCQAPIGWQYPMIEIGTVALCLAFYSRYGFSAQTLCLFALAPLVTSIIAIDLNFKIIPDGLNLAMLLLGIVMLGLNAVQAPDAASFILERGGQGITAAVIYIAASLFLRWAIMVWRKKDALGLGDVKFFGVAGFWLGLNPDAGAYLMLVAGVIGIILALFWQRVKKEAEFPFGPAILLAFVAMLLWQGPVFLLQ